MLRYTAHAVACSTVVERCFKYFPHAQQLRFGPEWAVQVLGRCGYSFREAVKAGDLGCVLPTCALCCSALQIGYRHVVDATLQEEACSLASLLVSVTSKGVVTCTRKVGKGSLDPESVFEMMEVRLWFRGGCRDLAGSACCCLPRWSHCRNSRPLCP